MLTQNIDYEIGFGNTIFPEASLLLLVILPLCDFW